MRLPRPAAAAAALLVIAPAAISSAAPDRPPGAATTVITGTAGDGSFLGGYFTATGFVIDPAGVLLANGVLNGTLSAPGLLQRTVGDHISLPVDRQNSVSNCERLNLAIGPADVSANGYALHLKQTELTITQGQGPGSRLVVPNCEAAQRLRGPVLDPAVVNPLNEIIRLVDFPEFSSGQPETGQ